MENQHRKISGYRELSQAEIDLMNHIKEHAEETRTLIYCVSQMIENQPVDVGAPPSTVTSPNRWLAIAMTDLQQGYMALTRAVAQPTTF